MKTTTSERASVISVIAYCIRKRNRLHTCTRLALSFLYSPSDMTETQQALNILRPYGM